MTVALLPLHVFVVTSVVTVYTSTVCLSLTRQMIYIFLHPVLGVTCLSRWNLSSVRRKEHKHFEAGYSLSYSDLVWLFSKFDVLAVVLAGQRQLLHFSVGSPFCL